jgi:hypothetical protein
MGEKRKTMGVIRKAGCERIKNGHEIKAKDIFYFIGRIRNYFFGTDIFENRFHHVWFFRSLYWGIDKRIYGTIEIGQTGNRK